jgi:hypothetical protein
VSKDIEVNIDQYRFSHGHAPRGEGQWGFFFDGRDAIEKVFWAHGTFGQAKRAAKKEARRIRSTFIEVAP